ncbi:hypothetical protein B1218_34105, partial [Pseudomonas ogarae]
MDGVQTAFGDEWCELTASRVASVLTRRRQEQAARVVADADGLVAQGGVGREVHLKGRGGVVCGGEGAWGGGWWRSGSEGRRGRRVVRGVAGRGWWGGALSGGGVGGSWGGAWWGRRGAGSGWGRGVERRWGRVRGRVQGRGRMGGEATAGAHRTISLRGWRV